MMYTCVLGALLFPTPTTGDWQLMFILVSAPILMAAVLATFYLKESPRYAFFEDYQEGLELLDFIHQKNFGVPLTMTHEDEAGLKEWLSNQKVEIHLESSDFTELFRGDTALITIMIWIVWFMSSLGNYGMILALPITLEESGKTSTTDYLEIALSEVGELCSSILCFFIIENPMFGRKNSLIIASFLATAACVLAFFTRNFMFLAFIFLTRFAVSSMFAFIFPLTAELYHTKIRSTGLGYASALRGLGGISVPVLVLDSLNVSAYFPYLVFGLIFAVSGFAMMFLPYDTTMRELDIIEEKQKKKYHHI